MENGSQVGTPTLGQRLMFSGLLLMGLAVFAPCVILPTQEQRLRLEREQRRLGEIVAMLEAEATRGDYIIEQLETNPVHIEKMAEAIGVRGDDEYHIPIMPAPLGQTAPAEVFGKATGEPAAAPAAGRSWRKYLTAAIPWREAFLDPDRRRAMLMLSAGVILTAFILFGRIELNPMPARAEPAPLIEPDSV